MATGGGGSGEEGREIFTAALEEGLKIEWVDVDDISDDTWTVSPYAMGSIAPPSPETQAAIARPVIWCVHQRVRHALDYTGECGRRHASLLLLTPPIPARGREGRFRLPVEPHGLDLGQPFLPHEQTGRRGIY
ncbi:MAG: DUF917 family protein [Ardenticatenales bacterium]|nr:DUF917 family protein [Ardenticatenales bacterium]